MNGLTINLIRGRVPDVRRRRNLHLAFLGYLLFSGALLVWVANLCARRLVGADYHRHDWLRSLSAHAQTRPGDRDPDTTLARLHRDVQLADARLATVEKVLQQRVPMARVLLALRHPLPPDIRLVEVSYNRAERLVQFGLATPEEASAKERVGTAELTARWAADPMLSALMQDIKPVRTERAHLGEQPVLVERYSATLANTGNTHGPGTLPP